MVAFISVQLFLQVVSMQLFFIELSLSKLKWKTYREELQEQNAWMKLYLKAFV